MYRENNEEWALSDESWEQNIAVFVSPLVFSFFMQQSRKFKSFGGELQYLALNHQSCEEGRALRALALLSCLSGSGFAAVVLLVRP